jgi:3-deoxy-D-manno-octulosonic-acid transferase
MIAGSTHKGENDTVYKAFLCIRNKFPEARLIIAPRYIYQADLIVEAGSQMGITMVKRSDMQSGLAVPEQYDGVILDTIGELGRVYSLGDLIFVGGSLAPIGGHNILEPAAHGKPIIVGPNMFNFKEIFDLLSSRGACIMVHSEKEFIDTCMDILTNQELSDKMKQSCIAVVQENQGATQKNLAEFRKLLDNTH